MKKNNKNIKLIISVIVMLLVIVALIVIMNFIYEKVSKKEIVDEPKVVDKTEGFNNSIIQEVNKNKSDVNYVFSPYSIELVLAMVREGALGEAYDELNKLVPERNIKLLKSNKRINVANAMFIKNGIIVKDDYQSNLVNKYNVEFLYDAYKTPDVINAWANRETYGMIPKVMEDINPEFLFGLGNAVAVDLEWYDRFKCEATKMKKFTKIDGSKVNVAMMHNSYESGTSYYKDSDATYVSIPYMSYNELGEVDFDNGTQLEFIGILPNDDVNEFIENYNFNSINKTLDKMKTASDKLHINVKLPRFKYADSISNLIDILKNLGLNETFEPTADFSKIAEYDMRISDIIHKSYIELAEFGTKAAAVTVLTFDANAMPNQDYKEVNIDFDKPFVYLIKDKNSDELLFFGVVYEPTVIDNNTVLCEKEA